MSARGVIDWLAVPVPLLGTCVAGTALVMALLLVPNADFHGTDQAAKGWVKVGERSMAQAGVMERYLPVRATRPTALRAFSG